MIVVFLPPPFLIDYKSILETVTEFLLKQIER